MKHYYWKYILLVLLFSVFCGCQEVEKNKNTENSENSTEVEENTDIENPENGAKKEMIITISNNNKKVAVSKDIAIKIKLEVSMGTGYTWSLTNKKLTSVQLDKEFIEEEKDEKNENIGKKEYKIFSFSAIKEGSEKLSFEYKRPWEKESKPEKTFIVTLDIK